MQSKHKRSILFSLLLRNTELFNLKTGNFEEKKQRISFAFSFAYFKQNALKKFFAR